MIALRDVGRVLGEDAKQRCGVGLAVAVGPARPAGVRAVLGEHRQHRRAVVGRATVERR
jgi:hypothetical protein